MNKQKYLWTLYLIITTIVISIVVQVYWNTTNYQVNKKHFFNQVQSSLDNATDLYYADLAKNRFLLNQINSMDIMRIDVDTKDDSKTISIAYKDSVFTDSLPDFLREMIGKKPIVPR